MQELLETLMTKKKTPSLFKYGSINDWLEHLRKKRELKAAFRRQPKPAKVKPLDENE
jgi:hypothetical protein